MKTSSCISKLIKLVGAEFSLLSSDAFPDDDFVSNVFDVANIVGCIIEKGSFFFAGPSFGRVW